MRWAPRRTTARRARWAIGAVVARFVHTEEVTGSNPVSPTDDRVRSRSARLLPVVPAFETRSTAIGTLVTSCILRGQRGCCRFGDPVDDRLDCSGRPGGRKVYIGGTFFMRSFRAVHAGVVATALALVPVAASAAISQPVVKANAADYTPQLVPTTSVPSPEVNGIAVSATSGLTYAGGKFDKVTGSPQDFGNVVAFNTATGAVRDSFHPRFNNLVRDVEDA